ncbi:hypothetical protein BTZ20_3145 [Rhodococcus sp. MTM3W5.2]|nr:hypothetical protein BTZ20_3145 [Rhodococcus sp. MTM3W5.2]
MAATVDGHPVRPQWLPAASPVREDLPGGEVRLTEIVDPRRPPVQDHLAELVDDRRGRREDPRAPERPLDQRPRGPSSDRNCGS